MVSNNNSWLMMKPRPRIPLKETATKKKDFKLAYFNDFSQSRRGRPRNSYPPQVSEFDANLIREFRSRPAFYDRNDPRFKDKVFTAREWQEISNNLGYDVSLLKDRMLQLRNRYNLEKRRIEQIREEHPDTEFESPWPLFEHLHFLSEHIRARRSYKRMLNAAAPQQATRSELQSPGSNSSSGGGADDFEDQSVMTQLNMHPAVAFQNGFLPVRVKMEQHDDDIENTANGEGDNGGGNGNGMTEMRMLAYQQQQEQQRQTQNDTDADESESQSLTDNGAFLAAQSSAMLSNKQHANALAQQRHQLQHHQQQQQQQHQTRQRLQPPQPLKIRRLENMRQGGSSATASSSIPMTQIHKRQSLSNIPHIASVASAPRVVAAASMAINNKQHMLSSLPIFTTVREQKYSAFGEFVASSLLDLPSVIAMQLIEKFTSEMVKVLTEQDAVGNGNSGSSGGNAQKSATTANTCNGNVISGTVN